MLLGPNSRECANSREWSDEDKKLKANRLAEYYDQFTEEELTELRKDRAAKAGPKCSATRTKQLLERNFEDLGYGAKRKRILIEQNFECNRCHLTNWQGEEISLEMDHKDGNKKNNARSNLECLCPNCHALTPTWRGKNRIISG